MAIPLTGYSAHSSHSFFPANCSPPLIFPLACRVLSCFYSHLVTAAPESWLFCLSAGTSLPSAHRPGALFSIYAILSFFLIFSTFTFCSSLVFVRSSLCIFDSTCLRSSCAPCLYQVGVTILPLAHAQFAPPPLPPIFCRPITGVAIQNVFPIAAISVFTYLLRFPLDCLFIVVS